MDRKIGKRAMSAVLVLLLAGCTPAPSASETPSPAPSVSVTPSPAVTVTPSPAPTASMTPSPAPSASLTPSPVPTASVTPSTDPQPTQAQPPLGQEELAVSVPDFLDEEQQDLYRRAWSVYVHVFGLDTTGVDYAEQYPGDFPSEPYESFEEGGYTYLYAKGLYRDWVDFDALLRGVFTDSFILEHNYLGGEQKIYMEKDGRLCFVAASKGGRYWQNGYFPDTFELLYRSENEISFYLVGYYSYTYPLEGESAEAREARLKAGYEYALRFPITMVRTEAGWRFDTFYDTSIDEGDYPGGTSSPGAADAERAMITVLGLDIMGRALDELPEDFRAELARGGEERLLETRPDLASPWVITTYTAPGLEVQTVRLDWEHPEDWVAGIADGQSVYEAFMEAAGEQGGPQREFVCTLRLTDDTYSTVPGLRVGDSLERAAELGYPASEGGFEMAATLATGEFAATDEVVTEIRLTDGWRTCGNIFW